MSRQVVEMNVRGVARRVYLKTPVRGKNGSSSAQVYVQGENGRTSVTGTYSIRNGQRRFKTSSPNADLL